MVDGALKAFVTPEIHEDNWRPIFKAAGDLSATRNIIAHHPVRRSGPADLTGGVETYSIHIEPFERMLKSDYPGLSGKEELEVEDLKRHDRQVRNLESKLDLFAWLAGGERAARKTHSANSSTSE